MSEAEQNGIKSNKSGGMVFKSERCHYREFGVYTDGLSFAEKHPQLADLVKNKSVDELMDKHLPERNELSSAIRRLPEYLAFLKTTLRSDFFFAAFGQTDVKTQNNLDTGAREKPVKRTTQKDVEKFILERIKNQLDTPRQSHEFVVENNGRIVGYVELFDPKPCEHGTQCERGVFITADHQSHGYGKEAIIALTDYAFKVLGIGRIFTMADPENIRSVNNILHNSGGVHLGDEDSKYAHLDGGGKRRSLFHIYPENFYAAVEAKGHQKFLIGEPPQSARTTPPKPASGGSAPGPG